MYVQVSMLVYDFEWCFNTRFPVLQAEHIYNLALKSSDELFHVKLYEWMVSKDLTDKLMQVCYIVVITAL